MGKINLVLGAPCAGKTTYIRQHRARGEPLVDFDRLVTAAGGVPHEPDQTAIKQVAEATRRAGWARLRDGVDTDSWAILYKPSSENLEQFAKDGVNIIFIDPGEQVCLDRAEKLGRGEKTITAIKDWYATMPEIPDTAIKVKAQELETKKILFNIKAEEETEGTPEGVFVGYASVFDNVDSVGDKIVKGAFSKSLKVYSNGAGIPCYWGHQLQDPEFNIGTTTKAIEDDHGLKVWVQLDMDNPKAAYTFKLLKEGRVNQMSFGYSVDSGYWDKKDDCYVIEECTVKEVSVVPFGANSATSIEAVKAEPEADPETEGSDGEDEPDQTAEEEFLEAVTTLRDMITALTEIVEKIDPKEDESEEDDQNAPGVESSDEAKNIELMAKATLALAKITN